MLGNIVLAQEREGGLTARRGLGHGPLRAQKYHRRGRQGMDRANHAQWAGRLLDPLKRVYAPVYKMQTDVCPVYRGVWMRNRIRANGTGMPLGLVYRAAIGRLDVWTWGTQGTYCKRVLARLKSYVFGLWPNAYLCCLMGASGPDTQVSCQERRVSNAGELNQPARLCHWIQL